MLTAGGGCRRGCGLTVENRRYCMKLYLGGPMRNLPLFNFPAFFEAAKKLRAMGHEVWSPAEHDVEKDGFDPAKDPPKTISHYMARDLPAVCEAEALAMLPGWENSEGARLEVYVGRKLGKLIFDAETGEEIPDRRPLVTSTNPKDKVGMKKPPLDLIPPVALIHESIAMRNGALKYGPFNWRDEAVSARIYVGAAMRHLGEWLDGEENAPDSGAHHLGHARACCGILLDAQSIGKMVDDRPKQGRAAELIEALTVKTDPI